MCTPFRFVFAEQANPAGSATKWKQNCIVCVPAWREGGDGNHECLKNRARYDWSNRVHFISDKCVGFRGEKTRRNSW